jgi:hypothetical protein
MVPDQSAHWQRYAPLIVDGLVHGCLDPLLLKIRVGLNIVERIKLLSLYIYRRVQMSARDGANTHGLIPGLQD